MALDHRVGRVETIAENMRDAFTVYLTRERKATCHAPEKIELSESKMEVRLVRLERQNIYQMVMGTISIGVGGLTVLKLFALI